MSDKYEYDIYIVDDASTHDTYIIHELDVRARKGWELVNVVFVPRGLNGQLWHYMRRHLT